MTPSFDHGVASGDPTPGGVVLWTRVSGTAGRPVRVDWWVAAEDQPTHILLGGTALAEAVHDHTVHVDVDGLSPATRYVYGFGAEGVTSPTGRTRTAPDGPTAGLRIGLVCCASWVCGYFGAYRHLARRELDVVVHLGDYTYDDDTSRLPLVRPHRPPGRSSTLEQYRARYAQYRTDPDLQLLHQRHPMVAVWDDHDIADGAWRDGAVGHDPERDGPWPARRAAAVQAFHEWLPVRRPEPARPDRVYRRLSFGDLADLIMIDARHVGRDEPVTRGKRAVALLADPGRSILGDDQREWLRQELVASGARWRIVGNQVMMAPLHLLRLPGPVQALVRRGLLAGAGINPGQWDGYPTERRALLDLLVEREVGNLVVLSGDIHSSWASELAPDGEVARPPVAVELVTPSITSDSFAVRAVPSVPGAVALVERLVARFNRHIRFFELRGHGYVVVEVTPDRLQAEWWHVDRVDAVETGERLVSTWMVRDGDPRLVPLAGRRPSGRRRSRQRFDGEICAFGTEAGHRLVIGRWPVSPFGPIADVMLEEPDGRRVLMAPNEEVAAYITSTYAFDDVMVTAMEAERHPDRLTVAAGDLRADVVVGVRDWLGWLLRLVPRRLAAAPAWAAFVDPLARGVLPGVRTRGTAGGGRREWYGARDRLRVDAVTAVYQGRDLGAVADVHPPVRFGFGSAPRQPSIVSVTTTVEVPDG